MTLPIQSLLPLYGLTVTLRFNEKTSLSFFHAPSLSAFIRHLAGSPERFDELIKLDAPESGRCEYLIGDAYRFSLYGLQGSQTLMARLIEALQQLPFSAPKDDANMPFRRNVVLDCLHDAFSGEKIQHFRQLTAYTEQDLQKACRVWQGMDTFRIRIVSPIRLLKDKAQRSGLKGEARYCQQTGDLPPDLINNRLHDYFAALLNKQQQKPPARQSATCETVNTDSHLFWLNIHYTDSNIKKHAMGGMMGEMGMQVTNPAEFDWPIWILGQYTGFGQRTAFGFGRYVLKTSAGEQHFKPAAACSSLLADIGAPANLITALEHIQQNSEITGNDTTPDEDALLERLENDIHKLHNNQFTPPPLQGFIIDNADNSTRALSVPPFRDRVLQRAVAQVLQPIVDTLHYQHSYGYRTGRSRLNARYAIQSAWRDGYRWVYESDIADFFDSVVWQRLRVRLQALWRSDPLVDTLMQWMQAPVVFEGQTIKRQRGLPQGSPLSPLLANIMLDDFDNDMQLAGFKLIRFADDFIVLCKSKEQAQLAQQAAEVSLQEHGLTLNQTKTKITRMEDGFYYLGYLFVNDMALESPKRLRPQTVEDDISMFSWLSQVIARPVKAIEAPTSPNARPKQVEPEAVEPISHSSTPPQHTPSTVAEQHGERDQYGMLLCISGESCILRTENQRLQVERAEQSLYDVPWRQLHAVLLLGRHNITTPALIAAMEHNVPLHFANLAGKYQGVTWNGQAGTKGTTLWLKQQQTFAQPEHALGISRIIVAARLFNMRETLRLRAKTQHTAQLDSLIGKLANANTLAELNGFEGSATRVYFAAIQELLPAEFNFSHRNRQPPLDPYNALLSLGYSLLYSCLETVLRTDGLLPWQGVYHQPHGKHATLASDLMEPFRHLVERLALSLIKRRELKPDDFYITAENACYLNKARRNFYLSRLMAKFETSDLFERSHQQNLSLIRFIEHREDFIAWRIR